MRFPDYKKDIVDYATRNVIADSDMLALKPIQKFHQQQRQIYMQYLWQTLSEPK
jgi:hypothetical protein